MATELTYQVNLLKRTSSFMDSGCMLINSKLFVYS